MSKEQTSKYFLCASTFQYLWKQIPHIKMRDFDHKFSTIWNYFHKPGLQNCNFFHVCDQPADCNANALYLCQFPSGLDQTWFVLYVYQSYHHGCLTVSVALLSFCLFDVSLHLFLSCQKMHFKLLLLGMDMALWG